MLTDPAPAGRPQRGRIATGLISAERWRTRTGRDTSGSAMAAAEVRSRAAARGAQVVDREDETRREDPPLAFEDAWPDDEPFPLTDAECARLVRGHQVRWRGTLGEAL